MWAIFAYPLYFLLTYVAVMLAFLGLHVYVPSSPALLGFIARSMSAYLALIVCAAYGTLASFILRLFNLHYRYAQWTTAKAFNYVGSFMTGVHFVVLDDGDRLLNRPVPAVLLCNHQTELDILMLGRIWPQRCSVTAKKSLRNVPFLGWYMSLSGTIFIDRVDRTQALKAFERASQAMKSMNQSCLIFPEGTRSYSAEPMLLPFKKGAFHLAVQAQVDILPVVTENYSRILNVKAKRFVPGTARIKGEFQTLRICGRVTQQQSWTLKTPLADSCVCTF